MDILSLPVSGGDAHSAFTTRHTLHLYKSTLLLRLIAKADEAVSTRLAGYGIGDDLSRLARGEAELKLQYENEIVNFGTKVADENAVLRAVIFAANY